MDEIKQLIVLVSDSAIRSERTFKLMFMALLVAIISLSFTICFIVAAYFFSDYQFPTSSTQEVTQKADGTQSATQQIK